MWDTMSLILPLFVITLATEIPLFHYLYKSIQCSWGKAVWLGFLLNLVSYFVVFVIEIGLLFSWLSYAGHLDKKVQQDWQHPELLKEASGRIYATETVKRNHRFRYYDVQAQSWHSMSNSPSIDPQKWDVEGGICAFIETNPDDWKDWSFTIASLPDFVAIQKLGREHFLEQGGENIYRRVI